MNEIDKAILNDFKKCNNMENVEEKISPSQYFDHLKNAKQHITTDALKKSFDVFVKLGEKYNRIGQKESLKKLCFLADTLQKEEKLIEMGVDTYVYKDTIEDYIENVANKSVKIIELSRYLREIPDELVDTVEKTKEIFDEFYVVFTDYTGKEGRKVDKERRDKDPILFGVFKNNSNICDRFYFLGDWVDEFCDLTLDKMIEEYGDKKGVSPVIKENIPSTSEELIELLKSYKIDDNDRNYSINSLGGTGEVLSVSNFVRKNEPIDAEKPKSFFDKVRSIFRK